LNAVGGAAAGAAFTTGGEAGVTANDADGPERKLGFGSNNMLDAGALLFVIGCEELASGGADVVLGAAGATKACGDG